MADFHCNDCGRTERDMRHSLGCNEVLEKYGQGYRCSGCDHRWTPPEPGYCVYCRRLTTNYEVT